MTCAALVLVYCFERVALKMTIDSATTTSIVFVTFEVMAAVSVANIVKTSLGPVGLDKMMVDDVGVGLSLVFFLLRSIILTRRIFSTRNKHSAVSLETLMHHVSPGCDCDQ